MSTRRSVVTGLRIAAALWLLTSCSPIGERPTAPVLYLQQDFDSRDEERLEFGADAGSVESFDFRMVQDGRHLVYVTEPENYMRTTDAFPGDLKVALQFELPGSAPVPVPGDDYRVTFDATGVAVGLNLGLGGEDILTVRNAEGGILAEQRVVTATLRKGILTVVWNAQAEVIDARLYPPGSYDESSGAVHTMRVNTAVPTAEPTQVTLTVSGTAENPRALDWLYIYEYLPDPL